MASSSSTKLDDLRELLHEQRQELDLFGMMGSDLDLAYSLQLQEVLGSAPASSSSSSTPTSELSFSTYSPVSDESLTSGAGVNDEDVRVLMRFIKEDVDRLEQEVRDRELSEEEARSTRDDLNRGVHDQKVAAAILAIPEEEWANTGDYFEKPYGEGTSSGGGDGPDGIAVDESFRVYVKGMVSEERVKDAVVSVAGLGVAICDPRDYLILEIRKPLADGDGKGKGVLSAERVGFEALVEGLKAANELGLKRVSCFCDEYMIHQCVSTNQLSVDLKITMLAFEALTLRKKLEHFDIILVGRNEMKHAFKLAREAIVSQICFPAETETGKKIVETCVICMEDNAISDMFMVDGCLHRYCFSCMKQHVEVKLLNGKIAHCPHENCNSEVPLESCKSFLEPKFVDIMIQRLKEAALPPTEKVYCPYPRCSALMSKREVMDNSTYCLNDPNLVGMSTCTKCRKLFCRKCMVLWRPNPNLVGMSRCTKCRKLFCRKCMVPWHRNMTCEDYQSSKAYKRTEDGKLKSLARRKHWRQCVKCSNMIELAEGCYHISCRCGYEFCYTCGAEWKNKKATCSCPLWNERNIIRR